MAARLNVLLERARWLSLGGRHYGALWILLLLALMCLTVTRPHVLRGAVAFEVSKREIDAFERVCGSPRLAAGARWRVGVALPVVSTSLVSSQTGKSNSALEDHDSVRVLVLQAVMRSLAETSIPAPLGCIATTVFVGVAYTDKPLLDNIDWLIGEALTSFSDVSSLLLDYRVVEYPGGAGGMSLSTMYNALASQAVADGVDFVIPLNDDMLLFGLWRELLVDLLLHETHPPGFGVAFVEERDQKRIPQLKGCPPYPMVSRLHFALFDGRLFDDIFPSFGIDLALCELYASFNAMHVYDSVLQKNHAVLAGIDAAGEAVIGFPRAVRIRYAHENVYWLRYSERVAAMRGVIERFLKHVEDEGTSDGFSCTERRPTHTIQSFLELPESERAGLFHCSAVRKPKLAPDVARAQRTAAQTPRPNALSQEF